MRCPKCGGEHIVSNQLPEPSFERVVEVAAASTRTGHPGIGLTAFLTWGGTMIANHFREPWKCNDCKHTFSVL